MGDSRISQEAFEIIVDAQTISISQAQVEAMADAANTYLSQETIETIVATANTYISQIQAESITTRANSIISQLTIELLRGPEEVPPTSSPVGTFTVGAGLGLDWYIALQLSDSGVELRDKVVKPVRVTGKTTRGMVKVYGYGPKENINVADIEDGINQKATLIIDDTTQVQQSKRLNVNVKNAMTHTVRVEGIWDGAGIPDRIDEIVYEVAQQGVRR